MGKKYKITPEVQDFIIKSAEERPAFGCRKLSLLIKEKFNADISKSSISTLLKSSGLSKPVGRRMVHKRRKPKVTPPQLLEKKEQVLLGPSVGENIASGFESLPIELSLNSAKEDLLKVAEAPKGQEQQVPSAEPAESFVKEADAPQTKGLGVWLLKACDLCLGGAQVVSEVLNLSSPEPSSQADSIAMSEALIYMPILGIDEYSCLEPVARAGLEALTGRSLSAQDIQKYLSCGSGVDSKAIALFSRMGPLAAEILCIKFTLKDNSVFFIDAGAHSIWSTSHIPANFSVGINKVKAFVRESILADVSPLVLQAPPGFSAPAQAFLNFVACFQSENAAKQIRRIELYDRGGIGVETIEPVKALKRHFAVGLWPWQYEKICKDLVSSENQLFITDSSTEEKFSLRASVLTGNNTKILAVLTNLPADSYSEEKLRNLYLERWPNLEIGYQDFLGKIERSTHSTGTQRPGEDINSLPFGEGFRISHILSFWRLKLSGYCQRHFLPLKYQDTALADLKKHLSGLAGEVRVGENRVEVIFSPAESSIDRESLSYACQRVNESDVRDRSARKIRFSVKSL